MTRDQLKTVITTMSQDQLMEALRYVVNKAPTADRGVLQRTPPGDPAGCAVAFQRYGPDRNAKGSER